MNIPNFSTKRKEYDQHEYWRNVSSGTTQPDEYQTTMMELTKQAEAEGVFYECDMRSWMSEHTPFIPESVLFMQFDTKVEGGLFGMEVYYARNTRRDIEKREKNLQAAKQYAAGQVIGTVKVNGKKITKAIIEKIEGQFVYFQATAGRYKCTFSTEAANIEGMKNRAIEAGWRKP